LIADKGSIKFGYTRNDERGTVPNSRVLKNNYSLNGTYNLKSNLTLGATVNFSEIVGKGRYGTGYDSGRNVNSTFRNKKKLISEREEMLLGTGQILPHLKE
jgi:hypothetical protein